MRRTTTALIALTVFAVTAIFFGQGNSGGGGAAPAIFPRVQPLPFPTEPKTIETIHQKIRVVPFVRGLESPWSIAFLPNGDMLVTEKPGRLRVIRTGTLQPQPISGTPQVVAEGQGGLLEVLPHPRFAENQWIYLTYAKAGERGNTTALARGKLNGNALTEVKDIFVADAWSAQPVHFSGKLAWSRDGMLFMTVGERFVGRDRAQLLNDHAGKVLRLTQDGAAAPGNPFIGRQDAKPEIYTYGHRNLQGLAIHPDTGALWESEHGPQGGDELNLIQAGKNYGWPVITLGREYTGEVISPQPAREGMEQPVTFWSPSIGLSGMLFYTGDRFPAWKGNLFLGGLAGMYVQRVVFNERGVWGREPIIPDLRQRIRDVRQGPDGLLYLAVDAQQGGILRIEPGP